MRYRPGVGLSRSDIEGRSPVAGTDSGRATTKSLTWKVKVPWVPSKNNKQKPTGVGLSKSGINRACK